MKSENIFNRIPAIVPEEITEILVNCNNVRIERIISCGQSSPPNFWYDQNEKEWVLVLKGKAKLKFQNKPEELILNAGDYINIPAHVKHRVEWTKENSETIWLAIFYR